MSDATYSQRFDRAMALAVDAFRHKRRKGSGVPYIIHLLSVCAIVGEHGGSEDQLIAALLHDYLEDIEGSSAAALTAEFGEHVTQLVLELSDTTTRPKPPWKGRKERYLAHLNTASPEVKLISAADKIHNSRSILRDHDRMGDTIYERFTPSKEETLWYYRSCLQALRNGWTHELLDELEANIARLHVVSGVAYARD